MAVLRITLPFIRKNVFTSFHNRIMLNVRRVSTVEITKNLTLFSIDKNTRNVNNLKLENPNEKPLTVMLSWMLAQRKHVLKHADFYLKRGFDVINITITPWQLLWPLSGAQLVAKDIVTFLDINRSYNPLIIHGFSVGGYVWAEALVHMDKNRQQYQHIIDRISGQIWDSAADITEMRVGLPFAIFPKNPLMQIVLRQYITYHLTAFDKVATCHYIRASQLFHTNIVPAPALFFVSKADPIGTEESNRRAKETWDNRGIQTFWKCWDESPHVEHLRHHPEEYRKELEMFLTKIGLNGRQNHDQQIRAKL